MGFNIHWLMRRSYNRGNFIMIRKYATASEPIDHHSKHNLHPWPNSKKPTPYEIFHIDSKDENLSVLEFNKILKRIHSSYVKIYHPDISSNIEILDSKQRPLTQQMKRDRFDQIMTAYELLKDPRRRTAYNRYKGTSWDSYQPQSNSFESYRMANAHRKKYNFENDEEFWRAGTWEDYYKMKFKRKPPTKEELDKNKYKILVGVLAVATLACGLEIMLALNKTKEMNRQITLLNLKSMQDLQRSTDNYREGTTRFLRIRRFLLQRRSAFINEDDVNLEQLKAEDRKLLAKYAQQQVDKF
mmetsp:Transcript_1069/g.1076  ORF Transcript_1069/g.1076 Transcript_1069/m.1076 type:complete len:299 (-) Transcript_1069:90-986(-)